MYSVWNWNTGRYDYYRGDGAAPGTKVGGRRARGSGVGGVRLEDALPTLPRDAVLLGSGTDARGRVAVEPHSSATGGASAGASGGTHFQGFGEDASAALALSPAPAQQNPWLTVGIVLGGAWLSYKLLVATSKALW